MSEWITDRQPTEADGDVDGEVLVRKRPAIFLAVPWQYVAAGAPWCRTLIWRQPGPAAEPAPTTLQPRRFVSISRTVMSNGDNVLDAIDDDGTAWWWRLDSDGWQQHPSLPPREVPADA